MATLEFWVVEKFSIVHEGWRPIDNVHWYPSDARAEKKRISGFGRLRVRKYLLVRSDVVKAARKLPQDSVA